MFGISGDDPAEVRAAVESDTDQFVDEYEGLVAYAGSDDPTERAVAARCFALGAADYPSLVADEAEAIVGLLDDPSPEVRADAADALAGAVQQESVGFDDRDRDAVAGLLDDPSPAARAAGAKLLRAAADRNPKRYVSAVSGLEQLVSESLDGGDETDEAAVAALEAILEVVRERAEVAARVDETLAAAVERAPPDGVEAALRTLYHLASRDPAALHRHHGVVRSALSDDRSHVVRYRAMKVYHKLAIEHDYEALEPVADAVPDLVSFYGDCDDQDDRSVVGNTLTFYASVAVEPMAPMPDPFEADVRDGLRGAVALTRWIADADPSLAVDYLPCLTGHPGDESLRDDVRRDASWTVLLVGLDAPDALGDTAVDLRAVVSDLEDVDSAEERLAEFRTEFDLPAGSASGGGQTGLAPTETDVTFDDVVGMDELKRTARERIVDPLGQPELYERFGVEVQRGFLFHGPPGTGKTHFARALANESGFTFFQADVADIASTTVGEAAQNVAELFERAMEAEPALVFLDEIDAIATSRRTNQTKSQRQAVNQLLESLSRVESEERDVVAVGATNRAEDVDEALLRSGRLGEQIEFGRPDREARVALFEMYCEPAAPDVDDEWLADETERLVQADVAKLGEGAAFEALRRHKRGENDAETVSPGDVERALDGLERTAAMGDDFRAEVPDLTFDDVVGMDGLKETARGRIVDPVENSDLYERFGVEVQRGFLFHGPPGTGKSYFARALAGESGFTFLDVSVDDVVSKYIGEGAKRIGSVFDQAAALQPCIVFLDEIDALATDRGTDQTKSERQMVNQLLDSVAHLSEKERDVVVVAATNRIEDVDDALLRSGRLGERVAFSPPDGDARVALFERYCDPALADVGRGWLREATEGLVQADVAKLGESAAYEALQRYERGENDAGTVTRADVERALDGLSARTEAEDDTDRPDAATDAFY